MDFITNVMVLKESTINPFDILVDGHFNDISRE